MLMIGLQEMSAFWLGCCTPFQPNQRHQLSVACEQGKRSKAMSHAHVSVHIKFIFSTSVHRNFSVTASGIHVKQGHQGQRLVLVNEARVGPGLLALVALNEHQSWHPHNCPQTSHQLRKGSTTSFLPSSRGDEKPLFLWRQHETPGTICMFSCMGRGPMHWDVFLGGKMMYLLSCCHQRGMHPPTPRQVSLRRQAFFSAMQHCPTGFSLQCLQPKFCHFFVLLCGDRTSVLLFQFVRVNPFLWFGQLKLFALLLFAQQSQKSREQKSRQKVPGQQCCIVFSFRFKQENHTTSQAALKSRRKALADVTCVWNRKSREDFQVRDKSFVQSWNWHATFIWLHIRGINQVIRFLGWSQSNKSRSN